MIINKVSSMTPTAAKNLKRAALPAVSTLAILAGSSMSGGFPPRNLGEPVNDTLWHKLQFTWDMIIGKRDGSGTYTDIKEAVSEKAETVAGEESDSIISHIIEWLEDVF